MTVKALALVLLLGGVAMAQATSRPGTRPATSPTTRPAAAVRKGAFHTTFTDQSPLSPIEAQNKRHHIAIADMQRYTLAEESFEVLVPQAYDGRQKYGIMVWVSPGGGGGGPNKAWPEVLARRKLIFIGANKSGNERGVGVRFGLALDAVHNLRRTYNIDESRVYVMGFSGGAKVASMLAVIYPEVFHGAISMGGTAFYRHIAITGQSGKAWPGTFERPPVKTLDQARAGGIVLIIGTKDMNYDPVRDIFEQGFRKDGFKRAELVEIPDLEHRPPEVSYIDRAIESLDSNREAAKGAKQDAKKN